MVKIWISAADARRILKAINAPSATDPKLAQIYYRIYFQLKPKKKGKP